MGTILIIVVLILLLGGGGGYYGYRRYGGPGLGGALGLILIVLFVLWFFAVCISPADLELGGHDRVSVGRGDGVRFPAEFLGRRRWYRQSGECDE